MVKFATIAKSSLKNIWIVGKAMRLSVMILV